MIAYLVEDDPLKAGRLRDFLMDAFPNLEVRPLGSFQSGLRALAAQLPDFVLLDMTLPTFDRLKYGRGGRFRPLGGYDLMRKLQLRKLSPPVIVVTQLDTFGEGAEQVTFQEITAKCAREFPEMFVGSVYFRQGAATWQSELVELVKKIPKMSH